MKAASRSLRDWSLELHDRYVGLRHRCLLEAFLQKDLYNISNLLESASCNLLTWSESCKLKDPKASQGRLSNHC